MSPKYNLSSLSLTFCSSASLGNFTVLFLSLKILYCTYNNAYDPMSGEGSIYESREDS